MTINNMHRTIFSHQLLSGVLHVTALVLLVAGHFTSLGLALAVFTAFSLASLLQETLGCAAGKPIMHIWGWTMVIKVALASAGLIWLPGLGPAFLIDIIMLDFCLRLKPLLSGILSMAALSVLAYLAAGDPDSMILHAVVVITIYLLAHTVRHEQQLQQAMAEALYTQHSHEKKLADLNDQLRQYQSELAESAKVQERNRIAKGIHDTLGHTLTAVIVQLTAALHVWDRQTDEARICVQKAQVTAQTGLESVRATIEMLDSARQSWSGRLQETITAAEQDLQIRLVPVISCDSEPSAEQQEIILACLREGLTNGVRHGGATAFVLKLESHGGQITFYLEDNGRGCPDLVKGYGLTAMEEMAQQAGGSLSAAGIAEGGFYIRVVLPAGKGDGEDENSGCR